MIERQSRKWSRDRAARRATAAREGRMHQPVFITGANSGLGQGLAQYYATTGAVLELVARREDRSRRGLPIN